MTVTTAAHHRRSIIPTAAHRVAALSTTTTAALHQLTHTLVYAASHSATHAPDTRHCALENIAHRVGHLTANVPDSLEAAVQRRIQTSQKSTAATILPSIYHFYITYAFYA
jgi:hypothetical protein